MRVSLHSIAKDSPFIGELERINAEAFPPEECDDPKHFFIPMPGIASEVLGIFADDNFVGFMVAWKHMQTVYVAGFAIDERYRNHGLGILAMQEFFTRFADCEIWLCFEMLDPRANNASMRERRRAFYLRQGFFPTGWFGGFYNMKFELVSNQRPYNIEGFHELLNLVQSFWPAYRANLFQISETHSDN